MLTVPAKPGVVAFAGGCADPVDLSAIFSDRAGQGNCPQVQLLLLQPSKPSEPSQHLRDCTSATIKGTLGHAWPWVK